MVDDGQIALQLAVDAPGLVHSLALLEPGLPMVPGAQDRLGSLFRPMLDAYRSGDKRKAVEIFSDATFGANWQSIVERGVPGIVEQAVRDLDTFIQELAPTLGLQPADILALKAQPAILHQQLVQRHDDRRAAGGAH